MPALCKGPISGTKRRGSHKPAVLCFFDPSAAAGFRPCPHPPRGDTTETMTRALTHTSHPSIVAPLRHAEGHLRHVISMIQDGSDCVDIAQQLSAVGKAVTNAKHELIHDHIDHCLNAEERSEDMAQLQTITRNL